MKLFNDDDGDAVALSHHRQTGKALYYRMMMMCNLGSGTSQNRAVHPPPAIRTGVDLQRICVGWT